MAMILAKLIILVTTMAVIVAVALLVAALVIAEVEVITSLKKTLMVRERPRPPPAETSAVVFQGFRLQLLRQLRRIRRRCRLFRQWSRCGGNVSEL